jgi:hypothetical protein
MRHRCDTCAAESDEARGFSAPHGVWPFRRRRCHPCHAATVRRRTVRGWQLVGLLGAGTAAVLAAPESLVAADAPGRHAASLWFNCIVVPCLLLYPIIVVHELGHGLLARALGFTVHRVQIGLGARWRRFETFGLPFELNAPPSGGLTWIAFGGGAALAPRQIAVLLGGILAEATLVLGAVAVARLLDTRDLFALGAGVNPIPALAFICAMTFLGQLSRRGKGGTPTDLALVLHVLLQRGPARAAAQQSVYVVPAYLAAGDHRIADALRTVREGLAVHPEATGLAIFEASLLVALGDTDAAIARARPLVESPALTKEESASATIVLADALTNRRKPEDLVEADALSAQGLAAMPGNATALLVRASVLHERGEPDAAWPLLSEAVQRARFRLELATALCFLGWLESERGRLAAGAMRLAEARRLDAPPLLLAVAENAARRASDGLAFTPSKP